MRIATVRTSPLEAALSALGHEVVSLDRAASADVLWCSKSTRNVMSPELVDAARRANGRLKVVMWDGDVRCTPPNHVTSLGARIDLLLIGHDDDAQVAMLKHVGVRRVAKFYHGVAATDFLPPRDGGQGVFFGGTNYLGRNDEYPGSKFRYDLVHALVNAGFELSVFGLFWSIIEATVPVSNTKVYCNAMQRTAMTVGVNHFELRRYYTKRLFESLAAGRLHLTRYIPEMERDFVNHKHLVWFHGVEEALDLATWYLSNDVEREQVAANGRVLVMKRHRFRNRVRELEALFKEVTNEA